VVSDPVTKQTDWGPASTVI